MERGDASDNALSYAVAVLEKSGEKSIDYWDLLCRDAASNAGRVINIMGGVCAIGDGQ